MAAKFQGMRATVEYRRSDGSRYFLESVMQIDPPPITKGFDEVNTHDNESNFFEYLSYALQQTGEAKFSCMFDPLNHTQARGTASLKGLADTSEVVRWFYYYPMVKKPFGMTFQGFLTNVAPGQNATSGQISIEFTVKVTGKIEIDFFADLGYTV